ncbi:twin-arginine translocase TatA/TatE family subunit [Microbacterium sp. lyk4-40-TSB-66]|uniref:twin-arginine translocase TatA/TatE family subunit n=1 Tax=Microbacterium sp. lyk4-40-TSB-66 TaxID=3040294 RepID=UPI00254CA587|nr:twin-arginine translocase TatA/TatE family subunit [Microbacterium sp. lyk4-40-TSB-66]
MTFGLTIEKLMLIGLIAVMIIGPERLPAAAESLRRTIQQVRRLARTAQERVREELGPEVADVDWQRLDPRQYDPRRIIREALLTEPEAPPAAGATAAPAAVDESDPPTPPESRESGSAPEPRTVAVEPLAPVSGAVPATAEIGTPPPR